MIFSQDSPLSQYYKPPEFADDKTQAKLALLGYNKQGQQNLFGKISSWIPGNNLVMNKLAENTARKSGAKDTMTNIQEDFDNRVNKLGIEAGVVMGAAGAVTGNPQLIGQGLSMTTKFGGALAFDQNDLTTEGGYIYR